LSCTDKRRESRRPIQQQLSHREAPRPRVNGTPDRTKRRLVKCSSDAALPGRFGGGGHRCPPSAVSASPSYRPRLRDVPNGTLLPFTRMSQLHPPSFPVVSSIAPCGKSLNDLVQANSSVACHTLNSI